MLLCGVCTIHRLEGSPYRCWVCQDEENGTGYEWIQLDWSSRD